MKPEMSKMKPPLFFVPSRMLCQCGQDVFLRELNNKELYIIVECTNPFCSEHQKDKKIILPTFREYSYL